MSDYKLHVLRFIRMRDGYSSRKNNAYPGALDLLAGGPNDDRIVSEPQFCDAFCVCVYSTVG